jgi:hypothetical protein
MLVVPTSKDIVESWPVTGFEETDNKSKSEHLRICLCTCETESEDCPTDFEEGDPDWVRTSK